MIPRRVFFNGLTTACSSRIPVEHTPRRAMTAIYVGLARALPETIDRRTTGDLTSNRPLPLTRGASENRPTSDTCILNVWTPNSAHTAILWSKGIGEGTTRLFGTFIKFMAKLIEVQALYLHVRAGSPTRGRSLLNWGTAADHQSHCASWLT